MLHLYKFIISIIIFAINNSILADTNINITSDNLTIKQSSGKAIFHGSVIASFDDYKIHALKLLIIYANKEQKDKIKNIIIPNRFKLIKNSGDEIIFADYGHYDHKSGKLTLKGNIIMNKNNHLLVTDELVYLLSLKIIDTKKDAK